MTNNINRTMNVIAKRFAVVATALSLVAFSIVPACALSYAFSIDESGNGTLYDEEQGCYVDMNTYHAAYGYEYWDEVEAYGYWDNGAFYHCNCSACQYVAEGNSVIVPESNSEDASDNNDAENTETQENKTSVYVAGGVIGENNLSGEGWTYDKETNTLTLENYNYDGTGLFVVTDDSSENEDATNEDTDGETTDDETSDDGSWDDSEEESWDDEEYGDADYEDESEEDADNTEGDADDAAVTKNITGVINSDKDLTLHLNGTSSITVNNEGSDASYAVNVAGELKVEGDGVLYVKSATEEKVYGTEPKAEENEDSNSAHANVNTNDIDSSQTVNEAPVTQEVNEAPVSQNVDEGDVNVTNNNNIDVPDVKNNVSLPDTTNNITFNPNVTVELPKTRSEQIVLSGIQQRYPEVVKSSAVPQGKDTDAKAETAATDETTVPTDVKGISSETPETGDGMDLGILFALIAAILMGGGVGGTLLWKRLRSY